MDNIFEIKFTFEKKVRDEVIYKFSNKQGGSYNIFSYHWQCFVWAAIIGFLRNEPKELGSPLADKVFSLNTMKNNGGEKDAQALICLAIARYGSLDIMKDPNKAIDLINRYANGGFYHIMKLMENGENSFNDLEKVKQEIFSRDYDIDIDSPAIVDDSSTEDEPEDIVEEYNEPQKTVAPVLLQEQEKETWSDYEIELLTLSYQSENDIEKTAERLHKPVYSVKCQLARLGLINMPLDNVIIENAEETCVVKNLLGETLFEDEGKLKILGEKIYRFNLKPKCLTVKDLKYSEQGWVKGSKMLVAAIDSDLFPNLTESYLDAIEDFVEGETKEQNKIKVAGQWYDYYGDFESRNNPSKKVLRNSIEESPVEKKRWTISERKELKSFFSAGLSVDQLATYFKTSEESVIAQLNKMK